MKVQRDWDAALRGLSRIRHHACHRSSPVVTTQFLIFLIDVASVQEMPECALGAVPKSLRSALPCLESLGVDVLAIPLHICSSVVVMETAFCR